MIRIPAQVKRSATKRFGEKTQSSALHRADSVFPSCFEVFASFFARTQQRDRLAAARVSLSLLSRFSSAHLALRVA
jgi:hypothetical protein